MSKGALTTVQLSALAEMLLDFEEGAAGRGEVYARQGRVGPISWSPDLQELRARVNGSSDYDTAWVWDGSFWESTCTCPLGGWCKHAFALGTKALEQSGANGGDRSGSELRARESLETVLEKAHDRGLKPTEKRLIKDIEAMYGGLLRGRLPPGDAVLGLASKWNPWLITEKAIPREEIEQLFVDDEIPEDAVSFWQHLALLFRTRGWHIPSLLAPISDIAELEKQIAGRRARREVADWSRKLRQLGEEQQLPDTLVQEPATLRLQVRGSVLFFQRQDAPDTFSDVSLEELRSLVTHRLSASAGRWDVSSYALLSAFEDGIARSWGRKLMLSEPAVASALGRALAHPALRSQVVDEEGQAFESASEPLVWQFVDDPADPQRCVVSLVTASGESPPQPLLHLGGPPHLYVSGRTFYRGPAQLHARADAGWKAAIPKAVLEDEEVVKSLLRAGSRLPEWLRERVEQVPLRARLRGWLASRADGGERTCFALEAVDAAGLKRLVLEAEGWVDTSESGDGAARSGVGRIQFLDTDRMSGAVLQFQRLGLLQVSDDPIWGMDVTRDTPAALYRWLAGFPDDTELELAPELASLREPPARATFALEIEETGRDWFDVELVLRSEDTRFSREELALLQNAHGNWVRLGGKGWQRLAVSLGADEESQLAQLGLSPDAPNEGKLRFHAMQIAGAGLEQLADDDVWQAVQERAEAIRALPRPGVPSGFQGELRPYQHDGFHFLAHLAANGLSGILADDMGLGKTVQALTWLLWLHQQQSSAGGIRALVVCPKSVMINWRRETERFVPQLTAVVFDPKERSRMSDANLVIANYAQLRSASRAFLDQSWTIVILDEGQNIKNPKSQTAGIARRLQAEHRLVLTGTPIENRVQDLWSLFAFAMPGLLGTQAQFGRLYDDRRDATARERLARRVRHFLLRRTKAQVASDLPPRIEEDVWCELEGKQRELYAAELKRARQLVLGIADERAFAAQRLNVLHSLLRLRQICCHPGLVSEELRGSGSAKVAALFEQLEPILDEGHKVLVFSQFVTVLEILRQELESRGIGHLVITGQTKERQELVDRFQADENVCVFLLSLKAAGTGLNLTAASYVILFDPWWNPAVEAQAIDRTHRIGQTNQVIAYRLLALDTVEEKIRLLQREKAALASEVVQEETLARVLDLQDLRFVLS